MSRVLQRTPPAIAPNLTPMVDVVFILIVFFALIAHISRSERSEMALPRVPRAVAAEAPMDRRLVVNVLPAGEAAVFRVGVRSFSGDAGGVEALTELLRLTARRDPGATVVIRAERLEMYARVLPVLRACWRAGVERASVATAPAPEGAAQ